MEKLKTKQEIALHYSISVKTLQRWLTEAEVHLGRGLICPDGQEKINKIVMSRNVPKSPKTSPNVPNE